MNDASSTTSLLTRAKRLTALARAKRDNQKEAQDLGQFQTALEKLDQALQDLSRTLGVRRKLIGSGISVAEPPSLAEAARKLQAQVETVGRPTAQFMYARVKDVSTANSVIADENVRAWQAWASQKMEELPVSLVPRLNVDRRDKARTRVLNLRKWAAGPVDIGIVGQFLTAYDIVRDDLDSVGAATIDGALGRFENGRIRLSDLSDVELAMLREEDSLADQLFLTLGT